MIRFARYRVTLFWPQARVGNVREQWREKLYDAGRRTPVKTQRIRPARFALLSKVRSENFTGNVRNAIAL